MLDTEIQGLPFFWDERSSLPGGTELEAGTALSIKMEYHVHHKI